MLNEIDLSRADLNLLVLFETVMEERHVGRSAERLNLSASAVSHGLGRLRALLGDPLFLKTPRGVVPTAPLIAEILARVRSVVASAEPFDPARSTRRFRIGAPDGVSSVFLPPLLAILAETAPGIDISLRQASAIAAPKARRGTDCPRRGVPFSTFAAVESGYVRRAKCLMPERVVAYDAAPVVILSEDRNDIAVFGNIPIPFCETFHALRLESTKLCGSR
jgi:DNA-binding transcriptional LysR family regulator